MSGSCEFDDQFNGDHLGFSSAVHDVNGDGKVNILANAPSGDSGGRLDTGFVRLYRDFRTSDFLVLTSGNGRTAVVATRMRNGCAISVGPAPFTRIALEIATKCRA